MSEIIAVHGLQLDDWVRNEDENCEPYWTQLCDKHSKRFPESMLDRDSGHGACGVVGCWEDADHYLDFKDEDIK